MNARIECDLDGLRIYNADGDLVYGPHGWLNPPEPVRSSDSLPMDDLSPNIRSAVREVLHAGLEHPDPAVRNAREQLYNAVTFWPEDET